MNIDYSSKKSLSPWRKISLNSWKPRGDSSTYVFEEIIMDEILSKATEKNLNFHTFFIKALSKTLSLQPKINATIRFGQIYPRKDISIFFHTVENAITDDLSGVLFENGALKSMEVLNKEYSDKVAKAKNGETPFNASKRVIGKTPFFLTKYLLKLYSFIAYSLNSNLSIFKSPKNAYGSIMLTSIGSLSVDRALCPIAPYTKVPMVISMGKIQEKAIIKNGALTVGKLMTLGITFDHRIMDGIHFSDFFHCFKQQLTLLYEE